MEYKHTASTGVATAATLLLLLVNAAPVLAGSKLSFPYCGTPVNQVACKLDPDTNYVIGLWFGAWGENAAATAAGRQDYIKGESAPDNKTYWYTNNYCAAWATRQVCTSDGPKAKEFANVKPAFPANGYANGVQQLTFVNAMRVFMGPRGVARVEWDTQQYDASRVASGTNPPQFVVNAVNGTEVTIGCGVNVTSSSKKAPRRARQIKAPSGMVLGSFDGACRYSQGWGQYSDGTYKPKYFLGAVTRPCYIEPAPYPGAKFAVPNGDNPNDPSSSYYNSHVCS